MKKLILILTLIFFSLCHDFHHKNHGFRKKLHHHKKKLTQEQLEKWKNSLLSENEPPKKES